jgi:DNA-directed RNA polymerase subunit RPC12/RpoP
MPRLLIELLPPDVDCPHCGASLALDEEERTHKRFKCPACKKKIDMRPQVSGLMIEKRTPFSATFPKLDAALNNDPRMTHNSPGPASVPPRPAVSFLKSFPSKFKK